MTEPTAPAARPPASANPRPQNLLICLTGFMGSGKTSVGKELARTLHGDFVDLDALIEERAGTTVAEIFAREGEEGFRKRERELFAEALASSGHARVIALGGGAILQPEVAQKLASPHVTTVFLDAPPEELHQRCVNSLGAGARPLLKDLLSFKKLYADRLPAYRQSPWHVDTSGRPVGEIAAEIAAGVRAVVRDQQRKRS